ncbi:hypothetical protein VKT23_008903 [Stygiomarasmius scandens]|uniref:DNA 3'-5' helicase n=1 Tax=Marasmiellus scandens TaxID=2682957 RepID=A0ABR1JKI4_9AGAR
MPTLLIGPQTLQQAMISVRADCLEELFRKLSLIQPFDRVPTEYLFTLDISDQIIAIRLCILVYYATKGQEVPKKIQLEAALASIKADSLIVAATGFGKTHIMALVMLLEDSPSRLTITISPLTRLQTTQTEAFLKKYGIKTIEINQNTPREKEWWTTNIHDTRNGASQINTARHIITTAEQLQKSSDGHWTQLGLLIQRNPQFRNRIARMNIDEIHTIFFAGTERYGIPAFRKAWGSFGELRITLPKSIRMHGFTATCPPHVQKAIEDSCLRSDRILIKTTVNRPNTIYARHCVVKGFDQLRNFDCFIRNPFTPDKPLSYQPRILLFFDDSNQALKIACYLNRICPQRYRNTGFVRHYYSMMSSEYLEKAHSEFTTADGPCRILCATSAESLGVDFPDVDITVNVGVPSDQCEDSQRAGCGGRREKPGLHLVLYEPWVNELNRLDFDAVKEFGNDPDRPRKVLKPGMRPQERVSLSGFEYIQSSCMRRFKAEYMKDKDGIHHVDDCCDGKEHPNSKFSLQAHLPGPIYLSTQADTETLKRKEREENDEVDEEDEENDRKRAPNHKKALRERLLRWREDEHAKDWLRDVYPEYLILSDTNLSKIISPHPIHVQSENDIAVRLGEATDGEWMQSWGRKLFQVIQQYDTEHPVKIRHKRIKTSQ